MITLIVTSNIFIFIYFSDFTDPNSKIVQMGYFEYSSCFSRYFRSLNISKLKQTYNQCSNCSATKALCDDTPESFCWQVNKQISWKKYSPKFCVRMMVFVFFIFSSCIAYNNTHHSLFNKSVWNALCGKRMRMRMRMRVRGENCEIKMVCFWKIIYNCTVVGAQLLSWNA